VYGVPAAREGATVAELLTVVAALTVGYWIGRVRLGRRLDSWADSRWVGPHGLGWWRHSVMAVGRMDVTARPRRTLANIRANRAASVRAGAPVFDSQWISQPEGPRPVTTSQPPRQARPRHRDHRPHELPVLPRAFPNVKGPAPPADSAALFRRRGRHITCGNLPCPEPTRPARSSTHARTSPRAGRHRPRLR